MEVTALRGTGAEMRLPALRTEPLLRNFDVRIAPEAVTHELISFLTRFSTDKVLRETYPLVDR
jgi:hypothetical protein